MLIKDGKQYLEGIDSIDLLFNQLWYGSIDFSIKPDPRNKISIYVTKASFASSETNFHNKYFIYLHISGEYINPELPIKKTIANAVSYLIRNNIFLPQLHIKNKVADELSNGVIIKNLENIFQCISGIEFCFDFMEDKIQIAEGTKIITTKNPEYQLFREAKLPNREDCLIQEGLTTYYSNDYKEGRKSTLKLYDRAIWLNKKNNEYPKKFINANLFKKRIEFVFKNNQNTHNLTFNNLDGNYYDIIVRFIPYLAGLYKKYFLGKVLVDPIDHPYFTLIYNMAQEEHIQKNTELERTKSIKRDKLKEIEYNHWSAARKDFYMDNRKKEKDINNPPNTYFSPYDETFFKSPYDYYNEEDGTYNSDDGLIPLDDMPKIMPQFNTIKEIKDAK